MATNFEEITGKVSRGEELSDAEKKIMGEYKPVDVDAIANARAKSARQDAEKKLTEAQARISDLETKMEEMQNSDLSELDKMKKEFEKLTGLQTTTTDQLDQERKKTEQLLKDHKIDGIVAGMKFIEGYSPEDARIILAQRLSGVDLENKEAVAAKVVEFQTANKGVLVADTGGGAGSNAGGGTVNSGGKTFTREQITNMKPAEFLESKDEIWQAQNEGKIK